MTQPFPGQLKLITVTLNVQIKDVGVNFKVWGLTEKNCQNLGQKGRFCKHFAKTRGGEEAIAFIPDASLIHI